MRNSFLMPVLVLTLTSVCLQADEFFTVHLQKQVTAQNPNEWQFAEQTEQWNPKETAMIICDMWDKHWCNHCTERVAEMAPAMNDVLVAARKKGVLIIHAPSETMRHYENMPQRNTLKAFLDKDKFVAETIKGWQTQGLESEKDKLYPIEVVNDGCDCPKSCPKVGEYRKNNGGKYPWQKEITTLSLEKEDLVSDDGNEIGSYLKSKAYKNVIVVGVATNMCVMGRPFGLRAMKRLGFNAVLMRDMTDTMYNPNGKPYVSHWDGNRLMVNYIEKYVCPTLLSTDFTGKEPFRFADSITARQLLFNTNGGKPMGTRISSSK